jgi:hypothetical protein
MNGVVMANELSSREGFNTTKSSVEPTVDALRYSAETTKVGRLNKEDV